MKVYKEELVLENGADVVLDYTESWIEISGGLSYQELLELVEHMQRKGMSL